MSDAEAQSVKRPDNYNAAQKAARKKYMKKLTFGIDSLSSVGNFKHTTDIFTGAPFVARFALIQLMRGAVDVGDVNPKHLTQADWGAAYAAELVRPKVNELADELALMGATTYPTLAQFEAAQKMGAGFGCEDGARSNFDQDVVIYAL